MSNFDDSELVIQRKIAEDIIEKLNPILKRISEKGEKIIKDYAFLKEHFLASETIQDLEYYSAEIKKLQDKVNALIAVQDIIELLVSRNKKRLEYLTEKLQSAGVYNFSVDKKSIDKIISENNKLVNEKSLNLKQRTFFGDSDKFFEGEIIVFSNGRVDFSNEHNKQVLQSASPEFILKLIHSFPYSVSTIPDDLMFNSSLKNNILKSIIVYVAEQSKDKSIKQINEMLGNILENCTENMKIADFAKEVKNLFNVSAKQAIKKILPELSDEIDDKLIVNEGSPFLPQSKRVGVLANGLAGEVVKSEEEESEEIRIDKEKEEQLIAEIDEFLDSMFQEDLEEEKEQQQQQEDLKLKEIEIKNQEEKKKELEEKEKEQEEKVEEELMSLLKKDDWND